VAFPPSGREGVRLPRYSQAHSSGHAYRSRSTTRWAMGVVNRCAVGIYPCQQLLDWARGLDLDVDAAGAREPCLYLIPDYETDEEAEAILEEVYEAIYPLRGPASTRRSSTTGIATAAPGRRSAPTRCSANGSRCAPTP
jgi:hypothetical protein